MKIILAARETSLADAWQEACGHFDSVQVHRGSILDLACDALVSPANSFGFMDGGIDALYTERFGSDLQLRLRRQILDFHHGELLIGQAVIVETGKAEQPYVIAAPTMRVPLELDKNTINPYLAMRAVLLLVKHGTFLVGANAGQKISDKIQTVAFPGLGTGVGRMSAAICARQMRAALDDILLNKFKMPKSWAEASERHQLLYTDRPENIQY